MGPFLGLSGDAGLGSTLTGPLQSSSAETLSNQNVNLQPSLRSSVIPEDLFQPGDLVSHVLGVLRVSSGVTREELQAGRCSSDWCSAPGTFSQLLTQPSLS